MRECRGLRLYISQSVFRIQNSKHGYYVKSESSDRYYFVSNKTDSQFCTCLDYASHRADKCKHLYAVQYALRLGLVQSIDRKLPISSIKRNPTTTDQYKNLSIRTLNILEKVEIEADQFKTQRQQSWELDNYDF